MDIDRFGESHIWDQIERGLRLSALALWIALFSLVIKHLRLMLNALAAILKTPTMVLAMIGGVFLIAGWPFDKDLVLPENPPLSLIIEETLELIGYTMMLASSLAHLFTKDRTFFLKMHIPVWP